VRALVILFFTILGASVLRQKKILKLVEVVAAAPNFLQVVADPFGGDPRPPLDCADLDYRIA